MHWVGTWATSPQSTNAITFSNQTLRMIVHVSIGGPRVRVRFSNAYGTQPLIIGAAHVALRAPCTVIYTGYFYNPGPPAVQPPPPGGTCPTIAGSAIVPGSDRVLTFGGATSTKVFPGAVMVSDPVNLNVPDLTDLAVSFYIPNSFDTTSGNLITRHGTAKQTSYISAVGAGGLDCRHGDAVKLYADRIVVFREYSGSAGLEADRSDSHFRGLHYRRECIYTGHELPLAL